MGEGCAFAGRDLLLRHGGLVASQPISSMVTVFEEGLHQLKRGLLAPHLLVIEVSLQQDGALRGRPELTQATGQRRGVPT